ncbi:UdgX family uracil-DNA binding protein [Sinorhizobium medicae]|uniref:Type-4 uracil-DNA glycosylase n=3 Tax=Sinorhizobium medicae TaxID=110321 RepID=A0A6G1WWB8_9HYPH|nr:UdgX family uracil-DNA binding protein [Sinorhizobium medicae]ABR63211.1 phage SPO1 DNA polymerase-related protein [Sinorhizobium medicae WSM419]MDX0403708.1 UdgX family uracil-DNA binding protein [Sinorhizobium medicae]MDX0415403.1 UdgX family uracil-DNA binding protein [Sinorhizobium medicae]MDX0421386.1 UdgX family uracil-DNA binding protein [Sinorhizobium medicae]MDX0427430.1 UdgX family uracil-DNA binding protein [Sinorhizobium medicae]
MPRESAKLGPALAGEHAEAPTIASLRREAEGCERCDLYKNATQLVFGEGPTDARVVLVGEQPGDREDLAGRPFVGPAGRLLDECMHEAGIDRSECYLTNAVKHFKFEPRGKRRLHSRPNAGEVQACAWWLGAEIDELRPEIVVALGATALMSLLGRGVGVTKNRGQFVPAPGGFSVLVTIHPSYLLRIRGRGDPEAERARFVDDLAKVAVRIG